MKKTFKPNDLQPLSNPSYVHVEAPFKQQNVHDTQLFHITQFSHSHSSKFTTFSDLLRFLH